MLEHSKLSVIPVTAVEEMATRVKSYIDLNIAKEGRKAHNNSKKETHEGKKQEQHSRRVAAKTRSVAPYYDDPIRRSMKPSPH